MRMGNHQQRDIIMTIIHHLQTSIQKPFQFFLLDQLVRENHSLSK